MGRAGGDSPAQDSASVSMRQPRSGHGSLRRVHNAVWSAPLSGGSAHWEGCVMKWSRLVISAGLVLAVAQACGSDDEGFDNRRRRDAGADGSAGSAGDGGSAGNPGVGGTAGTGVGGTSGSGGTGAGGTAGGGGVDGSAAAGGTGGARDGGGG